MNHLTPISRRRNTRAFIATIISYVMLAGQVAPLALAARGPAPRPAPKSAAATPATAAPVAAAPVPQPLVFAPIITATKTDSFPDPDNDGKAEPGDVITYTVTINNTGPDPATNLILTDTVDPNTTINPGSAVSTPIAFNDTYNVIGNVRIQPNAAQGLLTNDNNPNTGNTTGLTASGPTSSAQGGNVVINSDGSFTYDPPVGFTGSDNFTYTVTSANGTDTATVTLTVAGMIFFVNDDDPVAGGDGRLTNPFNCLVGAGCFSTSTADEPGDNIFLFNGAYAGGLTLLANQKLIGQGASATLQSIAGIVTVEPYSDPLPVTNGVPGNVTITTTIPATNALTVSAGGITLRGFTVGNTTGAKIFGSAFGTLTAGNNTTPDLVLNGTGQALNLTNGTFAATSGFGGVATTSSGGAGVSLIQIAGTVAFGSTSVSGSTTQGIFVNQSTVTINFGNTGVTGGTDGISLQNNSAGTRTFGTLSVSGGSGSAFLHSVGGGNTTVSGTTTLSSAGNPVDIQNMTAGTTVNFAGLTTTITKTTTGGAGVNLVNNTGATITFFAPAITTSNGTGLNATGGGTINCTNPGSSSIVANGVGAQVAPAINANGVTFNVNFFTVSSQNSGGTGITLVSVSGSLTIGGMTIQNPTGVGISVATSSAALNFGSGGGATVNGSGGTGIFLNANTGAISFTSLNIAPDSGQRGLHATANTNTITSTSGTITTTNNTAVEIVGVSNGSRTPLNMQLTTVNTTGGSVAANGIFLQHTSATGSPGGFRVLGTGGTCTAGTPTCTGGRITSTAGADNATSGIGVRAENADSVVLTRMRIDNHPNFAIRGSNVNGFTLDTSLLDGTNGNNEGADEAVVRFDNLLGTCAVTASDISGGRENNFHVINTSGTLTALNITGSIFRDNSTPAGADGINIDIQGTAVATATVTGNTFTRNRQEHFRASARGTATFNVNFGSLTAGQGNTMTGGHPNAVTSSTLFTTEVTGRLNFNVLGNSINGAILSAMTVFQANTTTAGIRANGTISGNTIGTAGVLNSGSAQGDGITVTSLGLGTTNVIVNNNQVRRYNSDGIEFSAGDTSPVVNATVTSNTLKEPEGFAANGLHVNMGTTAAGAVTACFDIGGSPATLENDFIGSAPIEVRLRQRNSSTVRLPGFAGGTAPESYIQNRNVGTPIVSPSGTFGGGGACTQPGPFTLLRFKETAGFVGGIAPNTDDAPNTLGAPETTNGDGQSGDTTAAASTVGSASNNELPTLTNRLREVVSATRTAPDASNSLDMGDAKRGSTLRHSAADTSAPLVGEPLALTQGKKTPSEPEPKPAPREPSPTPNPPVINGDTLTFTIGTLPANNSVTITFQVTVDNPYNGPANVSNQGTVTADGGISVLTDDPSEPGTNNPTVTPIDSLNIFARDAKVAEPATGTTQMLFTIALSAPAAGAVSVNASTADGGATPATGGAPGSCGTAGIDYESITNVPVNFTAGQQVKTVPVTICSDAVADDNETLLLNISGAVGGTILDAQAVGTITANTPGTFLISELRTSGPNPNSATNEFVELYNNTDSQLVVPAGGFGVFKMGSDCGATPILIGTIPATTTIPARGHYLMTGADYSLTGYAASDLPLLLDIETDRNVAVFSTADISLISSAARLDGVGFGANQGNNCALLSEGNTLPPVSAAPTLEYTFFRKECDFVGNVGCSTPGIPKDTNDNAADFAFADTQATPIAGIQHRLGAPGPQNRFSPIKRDGAGAIVTASLDATKAASVEPNRSRDFTSNPGNNSTQGTLSIRRRFINNSTSNVTRLRFRIVEMTTAPNPPGVADLRAITSADITVTNVADQGTCTANGSPTPPQTQPCSVTVKGTTLEQPPTQTMGGGYNSTLSVALPGGGLAPNASVSVQFLLGIQQGGSFRFLIIIEALP